MVADVVTALPKAERRGRRTPREQGLDVLWVEGWVCENPLRVQLCAVGPGLTGYRYRYPIGQKALRNKGFNGRSERIRTSDP